jgi:mono/diheme cytochrome c family protein
MGRLSVGIIFVWLALPGQGASAQQASGGAGLSDTQMQGQRLFAQSCGVCHTKPTITAGLYGPPLSKESLGGQEDVMVQVISNGTPRMPGFQHHFNPDQIKAIVSYVKTLPVPPPETSPPPRRAERGQQREDN